MKYYSTRRTNNLQLTYNDIDESLKHDNIWKKPATDSSYYIFHLDKAQKLELIGAGRSQIVIDPGSSIVKHTCTRWKSGRLEKFCFLM